MEQFESFQKKNNNNVVCFNSWVSHSSVALTEFPMPVYFLKSPNLDTYVATSLFGMNHFPLGKLVKAVVGSTSCPFTGGLGSLYLY